MDRRSTPASGRSPHCTSSRRVLLSLRTIVQFASASPGGRSTKIFVFGPKYVYAVIRVGEPHPARDQSPFVLFQPTFVLVFLDPARWHHVLSVRHPHSLAHQAF